MTQFEQPISFRGTKLFKPIKLGDIQLSHRVALAPLTRLRNEPGTLNPNVSLLKEYYSQRSQRSGTLIITEGTITGFKDSGFYPGMPGIFTDEQVESWKEIFNEIHTNGSFVVSQLCGLGRLAYPKILQSQNLEYVAPSPIYIESNPNDPFEQDAKESGNFLREFTGEEIVEIIENHVLAAKNAIDKAGADGVQIHAANGYLLNQFLDPCSNQRTDKYGGSIENRSRIILEIIDRLDEELNGLSKISVRISPFGIYGGLKGCGNDPTLLAQYAHLIGELEKRRLLGKELQFIEFIQPRYSDFKTQTDDDPLSLFKIKGSNDFISTIWKGKLMKNGNYGNDQSLILEEIDERSLISIGRNFISNPDLPDRLENGWELTKYDRTLFYAPTAKGFTDYPNYEK